MVYRIPSIVDINARAGENGLKVISTFAGTGGSSTGYKMAGYKVLVAAEFVPAAADSYQANAPHTTVIRDDIRTVTAQMLLDAAGLQKGELDLFDGSPPCSSFSMAGKREKGWNMEKHYSDAISQRTDDLFLEFLRLVEGMMPKVVVAENVSGLVNGVARGYFKEIYERLEALGYRVAAQVLDASLLGVPQRRTRLIFVAVRNDLNIDPPHPKPFDHQISIREAIEGLPEPDPADYYVLREGTRTRMAWDYTDLVRDKGCFREAYLRLYAKDARYMWFKVNPSKPCPTVTAKIPTLFRWDSPRSLSIPELKRICSFPDDFELTGTFDQRWERLGRAVPPLLMKAVAETIAKEVFGR